MNRCKRKAQENIPSEVKNSTRKAKIPKTILPNKNDTPSDKKNMESSRTKRKTNIKSKSKPIIQEEPSKKEAVTRNRKGKKDHNKESKILCGESTKIDDDNDKSNLLTESASCLSLNSSIVHKDTHSINFKDLSALDVSEILKLGESQSINLDSFESIEKDGSFISSSDEDKDDWEEVDTSNRHPIPSTSIEITVPSSLNFNKKSVKKSKEELIEEFLRKRVLAHKRKVQIYMHKANIVCLLSHYFKLNSLLNSEELIAIATSCISSEKYYPPKRAGLYYLEQFLKWFRKKVTLDENCQDVRYSPTPVYKSDIPEIKDWVSGFKQLSSELKKKYFVGNIKDILVSRMINCVTYSWQELVMLFILFTRAVGLDVRIVVSFQCVSIKPPGDPKEKSEQMKKKKSSNKAADSKSCPKRNASSDSDEFELVTPKVKKSKPIKQKSRKLLSADESHETILEKGTLPRLGRDLWAEVYLEEEEKWISVDVVKGNIHCNVEIAAAASSPIVYVIGFNNQNKVKDLSKKYAPRWFSQTEKLRIEKLDSKWLSRTLRPYLEHKSARSKLEDEEIESTLKDRPLPTTISEYKSHPLYALRRHLLKFEAIYPADAPPLGYIRSEPVYARECVHTLCSRETWLKEARLVRLNEQPYKVVSARPKFDRMTGQVEKNRPLEIFGEWQTEPYIPPVAHDGKVPRNEYGNVDLFKPSMLPVGTVIVDVPGINRLARKLNIDCAQATVGFDFHSGGCHPVFGGWVICEEFHDILMDAYTEDLKQQEKKYQEKYEKKVYGNWKRLIKGLLIRERLQKKYDFNLEPKKKSTKKGHGSNQ